MSSGLINMKTKIPTIKLICVECGEYVMSDKASGSLKHPYCEKCYSRVWKNDEEYSKFLSETHI